MSDDQKLLVEMDRATQAQDLMDHPLLKEAFETMRTRYLTEWESSPARDSEGREKIWTYLKQLETVKSHLLEVIQTGKMAQVELGQRSLLQKARDGLTGFRR